MKQTSLCGAKTVSSPATSLFKRRYVKQYVFPEMKVSLSRHSTLTQNQRTDSRLTGEQYLFLLSCVYKILEFLVFLTDEEV